MVVRVLVRYGVSYGVHVLALTCRSGLRFFPGGNPGDRNLEAMVGEVLRMLATAREKLAVLVLAWSDVVQTF